MNEQGARGAAMLSCDHADATQPSLTPQSDPASEPTLVHPSASKSPRPPSIATCPLPLLRDRHCTTRHAAERRHAAPTRPLPPLLQHSSLLACTRQRTVIVTLRTPTTPPSTHHRDATPTTTLPPPGTPSGNPGEIQDNPRGKPSH